MESLQRWWNLSKRVTNSLVNFGNFFNSLILSPPFFSSEKNIFRNRCSGGMGNSSLSGDNDGGEFCLGDMSKNEQIQFFDFQMYLQ